MDFEKKISLIVGLKNNLDYTQSFYKRLRELYKEVEVVFVSYGSTDGTHEWLDSLNDKNLKYYYSEESKSLSHTYNKGVEISTSELISYLHNDIIIGKGFLEELVKSWQKDAVLFYSLVEPPIFADDKRDWKTNIDFGNDIMSFDEEGFDKFVEEEAHKQQNPFETNDESFFICVERKWLVEMGGLDTLFYPMFYEDSDLIMRFYLQNARFIVVPKAIGYHFVSKTSRYSKEFEKRTKAIEELSFKNFFRKWRCDPNGSFKKAYDLVAVVENATVDGMFEIEPFFAKVYSDLDKKSYVDKYQSTTKIDLSERLESKNKLQKHDIIIYLDEKKMKAKDYLRIKNLSDIIARNEIKSKKFIKSLFKDYTKIRTGNISGKINNFRSLEKNFPTVVNQK